MIEFVEAAKLRPVDKERRFVDYIAAFEKRLSEMYQRHHTMLDFYLKYRRRLKFLEYEHELSLDAIGTMAEDLRRRRPEMPPVRANHICLISYKSLENSLDIATLLPTRESNALRKEWRQMLVDYIESLNID